MKTKTRCPICKRFISDIKNKFSHHMGINPMGFGYGTSKKQICYSSGHPISNPQKIIDDYKFEYNFFKQQLEEIKKRREKNNGNICI